jgi:hypothetical protein
MATGAMGDLEKSNQKLQHRAEVLWINYTLLTECQSNFAGMTSIAIGGR